MKGVCHFMSDDLSSSPETKKNWPHAPIHQLTMGSVYMITAATIHKIPIFTSPAKLTIVENALLSMAKAYFWHLEAWAIFSNHYHFIARGQDDSLPLEQLIHRLHSNTARKANELDGSVGRRVWYNFWDTRLTFQKSYMARLNYVHQNPVKHGLVQKASNYQWCSAAWFERTASAAMVNTIYGVSIDKVNVYDEF